MEKADTTDSTSIVNDKHDNDHPKSRLASAVKGVSKGATSIANNATKLSSHAATTVTQGTKKAASALKKGTMNAVTTSSHTSGKSSSVTDSKHSSSDVDMNAKVLKEVSTPRLASPVTTKILDPPVAKMEPTKESNNKSTQKEIQKGSVKVETVKVETVKVETKVFVKESLKPSSLVATLWDVVKEPDLWKADATIFFCVALSISVYPTLHNKDRIWLNQIPLSVTGCWLLVSFAAGLLFSLFLDRMTAKLNKASASMADNVTIKETGDVSQTHLEAPEHSKLDPKPPRRNFLKLFGAGHRPIHSTQDTTTTTMGHHWTNLNKGNSRKRQLWETDIDPTTGSQNVLMQKLLSYRTLRKTSRSSLIIKKSQVQGDVTFTEIDEISQELGNFGVTELTASSFDEDVIEPLFQLRGMDIFLTEDPENEAGSHPWLVESGLRDVPTFVLNFVTQWGNVFLYYEMSEWVTDWDIKEDESDADDIKALKRFLNGTDDYRNARLKMVPSIVDAPFAVKMVAPPKSEKTVHCDWVQVAWKKHEKGESPTGRKLCVALEATLDLMSTRGIRTAASLIKNNLKLLVVDVAIVISKPDSQVEEEPMACVGCWRMNHVDIKTCPNMPDRYMAEAKAKKVDPSVVRASVVCMDMNPADLEKLLKEQEAQ